jgi:hypothetical protein
MEVVPSLRVLTRRRLCPEGVGGFTQESLPTDGNNFTGAHGARVLAAALSLPWPAFRKGRFQASGQRFV